MNVSYERHKSVLVTHPLYIFHPVVRTPIHASWSRTTTCHLFLIMRGENFKKRRSKEFSACTIIMDRDCVFREAVTAIVTMENDDFTIVIFSTARTNEIWFLVSADDITSLKCHVRVLPISRLALPIGCDRVDSNATWDSNATCPRFKLVFLVYVYIRLTLRNSLVIIVVNQRLIQLGIEVCLIHTGSDPVNSIVKKLRVHNTGRQQRTIIPEKPVSYQNIQTILSYCMRYTSLQPVSLWGLHSV